MISAIRHAHIKNGLWSSDGGFEYNLVLLAALAAVTADRSGNGWALAQLGAGAAGSFLMNEAASREAAAEEKREEPAETSWSPAAFDSEPARA